MQPRNGKNNGMHGSTTTSSAKSLTSRQSAQIHEIAKEELVLLKIGYSITSNKDMDG